MDTLLFSWVEAQQFLSGNTFGRCPTIKFENVTKQPVNIFIKRTRKFVLTIFYIWFNCRQINGVFDFIVVFRALFFRWWIYFSDEVLSTFVWVKTKNKNYKMLSTRKFVGKKPLHSPISSQISRNTPATLPVFSYSAIVRGIRAVVVTSVVVSFIQNG